MMVAVSLLLPSPVAMVLDKARRGMDVLLHVGAHNCGSTSFQRYMQHNAAGLRRRGIGFWGPERCRKGLFDGLMPGPGKPRAQAVDKTQKAFARAQGRVRLNCAMQRRRQTRQLIVSDAGLLGSMADNLGRNALYQSAGERMARLGAAFDGQISQLVLSIRSLDRFWASAMSQAVLRGGQMPTKARLDRIVTQPRSWREVIQDLAGALPDVPILVMPFERMIGQPDKMLEFMTFGAFDAPKSNLDCWHNRTVALPQLQQRLRDRGAAESKINRMQHRGDHRWAAFEVSQWVALQEIYADDLAWLRAGADRMALLIEENALDLAGQLPGTAKDIRTNR